MRSLISVIGLTLIAGGPATAESWQTRAVAPHSVECVAAFELMNRAAPNWSQQPSVQAAWQSWEREAVRLSEQSQVDFGTQINRAMTAMAEQLTLDPNILSRRAAQCVADAPAA